MDWTEIKLQIPSGKVDEAAAIAQMTVPYGIYIEDYSELEQQVEEIAHIDLIDEDLLARPRDIAVIHVYLEPQVNPAEALAFLQERLSAEQIPFSLQTGKVRQEDWATAWQKYYHPMRVGRHIMICPEWETCELGPHDVQLTLNPGMAFGTGTHETTRLCMAQLENCVSPETTLLDIGCGSGILSITALLLGAKSAIGVDIDELAVKVAKENAALNGVQAAFVCGDLTDKIHGQYDVICANIVADVIIRLCENVRQFMHPGSLLLCSGIIEPREQEVKAALQRAGLSIEEINRENGWVAIRCRAV